MNRTSQDRGMQGSQETLGDKMISSWQASRVPQPTCSLDIQIHVSWGAQIGQARSAEIISSASSIFDTKHGKDEYSNIQ